MQENSSMLAMRVDEVMLWCIVVMKAEGAANDAITIVREGARPGEYRFKFPTWNRVRSAESHYDVAKGISVEVAPFGEAPVVAIFFPIFNVRLLVSGVPFAC
jgi:hypothetical protein